MGKIVESYKTIKNDIESHLEEEKSNFITNCRHVETEEDALKFIDEIKKKNKDASHNCYSYILNKEPIIKRYSDDGEPQGTAGMPILSVLEKEEVKNLVVVVTRYFGGKKLGKGGLVRTYTRAVSDCLKNRIVYKSPFYRVKLTHAYTSLGIIENFLNQKKYKIVDKEFVDIVKQSLYIKKEEFAEFEKKLTDITNANIKIEIVDKIMLYENQEE